MIVCVLGAFLIVSCFFAKWISDTWTPFCQAPKGSHVALIRKGFLVGHGEKVSTGLQGSHVGLAGSKRFPRRPYQEKRFPRRRWSEKVSTCLPDDVETFFMASTWKPFPWPRRGNLLSARQRRGNLLDQIDQRLRKGFHVPAELGKVSTSSTVRDTWKPSPKNVSTWRW